MTDTEELAHAKARVLILENALRETLNPHNYQGTGAPWPALFDIVRRALVEAGARPPSPQRVYWAVELHEAIEAVQNCIDAFLGLDAADVSTYLTLAEARIGGVRAQFERAADLENRSDTGNNEERQGLLP